MTTLIEIVEAKVGALSCWEHSQPLLKYHTYLQGEEIHVSAWPPLEPHPGGPALFGMSAEGQLLRNTWDLLEADHFGQAVNVYRRHMRSNLQRL